APAQNRQLHTLAPTTGPPTDVTTRACGRASDRHRTIDSDAMHQSSQGQLVVAYRKMLGHAVVPHQEIANTPVVPVAEFRSCNEFTKFLDEGQAFPVLHAANADTLAFAHIDGLASGHGMG